MESKKNPFQAARQVQSSVEHMAAFERLAKEHLGEADAETASFRRECKEIGFKVVFRSGLDRKATLAVLRSPETQAILASNL